MAVIQKAAKAVEVILLVKATKPVKVVIMAMLARTEAVLPDDKSVNCLDPGPCHSDRDLCVWRKGKCPMPDPPTPPPPHSSSSRPDSRDFVAMDVVHAQDDLLQDPASKKLY
jgi:hypothetical protein